MIFQLDQRSFFCLLSFYFVIIKFDNRKLSILIYKKYYLILKNRLCIKTTWIYMDTSVLFEQCIAKNHFFYFVLGLVFPTNVLLSTMML